MPQIYITPKIGSRNAQTTFYWLDGNVQVICGCFRGNLEQFEAKVRKVHSDTKHCTDYLNEIEKVKYLMK